MFLPKQSKFPEMLCSATENIKSANQHESICTVVSYFLLNTFSVLVDQYPRIQWPA